MSNSVSYDRIRYTYLTLQVQEIREANVRMILSALEQTNREVEQLIKEQKDKYYSKYISFPPQFSYYWLTGSLLSIVLKMLYLLLPFTGQEGPAP